MWSDLGFNIPITEGFYWLDRGIIRAFSSDGILHRLYKYKVNDDLTIKLQNIKNIAILTQRAGKKHTNV